MSLMKKYISNWDTLTEEQQKKAEEQFKGNPGLNTAVVHPAAKFFEENRWVKIDRFIDNNFYKEVINKLLTNYPNYIIHIYSEGKVEDFSIKEHSIFAVSYFLHNSFTFMIIIN